MDSSLRTTAIKDMESNHVIHLAKGGGRKRKWWGGMQGWTEVIFRDTHAMCVTSVSLQHLK